MPSAIWLYRPAHSTELAALKLVNNIISGLNDHKAIQHLYIDLSEAFDSLDHSILLHKLEYYGICNVEYLLLHSYLKSLRSVQISILEPKNYPRSSKNCSVL